ncbi:MAG TPA: L,D-transpeptidase family protein [Thermoanaerobaculia bacterium]
MLTLAGARPLPAPVQEAPPAQRVQFILRSLFPVSGEPPELTAGGLPFRAAAALPCFYERRGFAPAWSDGQGPSRDVDDLLAAIEGAAGDGLNPEDYLLAELRRRAETARRSPDAAQLAELDLLFTHAFLTLGAHLRNGRVNPSAVYRDCVYESTEADLPGLLQTGLDQRRVHGVLDDLAPSHPIYRGLKLARGFYRGIVARGGWPAVPEGDTLRPGDRDPRVEALRARMEASGFAADAPEGRDLYDAPLQASVTAFQERHGLEPDGVVGKGTLEILNVPSEDRLRQIEVNLERWRWMPRDLGERYIVVNIAGFVLDVVENGRTTLDMKVVVGKPATKTPMFSDEMTYLVLAPYWNVPPNIVRNEIVPRMRRDPGYLDREGMEVFAGPGGARLSSVDWNATDGRGLSIRQKPGRKNALGRVKFMFPNPYNVYLHDTPSRSSFSRASRAFSHGCIRLEQPVELAEHLLGRDDPAWTKEKIEAIIAKGEEKGVVFKEPWPVHLVYWTVWVDDAGVVQFREDLYGRDTELEKALGLTPAAGSPALPATRSPATSTPSRP